MNYKDFLTLKKKIKNCRILHKIWKTIQLLREKIAVTLNFRVQHTNFKNIYINFSYCTRKYSNKIISIFFSTEFPQVIFRTNEKMKFHKLFHKILNHQRIFQHLIFRDNVSSNNSFYGLFMRILPRRWVFKPTTCPIHILKLVILFHLHLFFEPKNKTTNFRFKASYTFLGAVDK